MSVHLSDPNFNVDKGSAPMLYSITKVGMIVKKYYSFNISVGQRPHCKVKVTRSLVKLPKLLLSVFSQTIIQNLTFPHFDLKYIIFWTLQRWLRVNRDDR